MNSHRSYNIQIESTLELWAGTDCEIYVEARAEITEFPYGEDADGRRGETRTEVSSIDIHTLILYVPNRPSLRLFETEKEIQYFLTEVEFEGLLDLVQEKVFRGEGEEV